MPELPEVETIRLGLQKYLIGHKILDVNINNVKTFQGNPKSIIGSKVIDITRLGKGLIIDLSNGFVLAIHLKMTGQIIYSEGQGKLSKKVGGKLPNKWTRVIFKLKSQSSRQRRGSPLAANLPPASQARALRAGKTTTQKSKLNEDSYLYFNDIRKFGWIKVIKKDEVKNLPFFKEMGPEPFKDLTFPKFIKIVKKSNSPIKLVLMDQKKIGGIGNIYANEALFLARINPKRKTKDLSGKELNKLYGAILEVLKRGIKYGGSSDVNYVNALGQDGHYQEHFLIYGRKGQKCTNCGGIIQKIMLGGRGTYFCHKCQK